MINDNENEVKMKNRYNINRFRPKHGFKYIKY